MNTEKKIQIYVRRGEHRLGPFSLEEVRSKLESGELEPKEPAWHEGLTGWSSLGVVLNTEVDKKLPKHSQAGISSAVIAGINAMIVLFLLISLKLSEHIEEVPNDTQLVIMLFVGCAILGLAGLSLIGVVFGLVGSFARAGKKGWAQTGLVVNGLILLSNTWIIGFIAYDALTTKSYGSL